MLTGRRQELHPLHVHAHSLPDLHQVAADHLSSWDRAGNVSPDERRPHAGPHESQPRCSPAAQLCSIGSLLRNPRALHCEPLRGRLELIVSCSCKGGCAPRLEPGCPGVAAAGRACGGRWRFAVPWSSALALTEDQAGKKSTGEEGAVQVHAQLCTGWQPSRVGRAWQACWDVAAQNAAHREGDVVNTCRAQA